VSERGRIVSYLSFDLDALNVVPSVSAAVGVRPGDIAHGLLQLWAYCFRNEVEVVSEVHLKGFFGVDAAAALVAFGFLESLQGEFRVRGAKRYLRVKQAQREGGKKGRAMSSSKIGIPAAKADPGADPDPNPDPDPDPMETLKSEQALSPSTEHRAPNIKETMSSELDVGAAGPIPAVALDEKLADAEFQVFEHWRVRLDHPRAKATTERKRLIAKWLKVYTVDELHRAIDGVKLSPYHMGQNDRHKIYDDLELILRDAKHIEGFMRLAGGA